MKTSSSALVAQCYFCICCIFTPSRHMVLTRFPTLTGLVSPAPVLHPCFSLASSASCDAFTEQQTSFMEPGPCSTQARSSLGKKKCRDCNGRKTFLDRIHIGKENVIRYFCYSLQSCWSVLLFNFFPMLPSLSNMLLTQPVVKLWCKM